jgi:hypothetical protein
MSAPDEAPDVRIVGVVLRRARVDNPWIDHAWSVEAVLPEAPAAEPGASLGREGDAELIYAGAASIELFKSETGNYRDNLAEGAPYLWVAFRELADGGVEVAGVTADPTEGESLFEAGAQVGKAAMPPALAGWIADYVERFHVERVFVKRQRDKSGPDPRKNPGARRGPGSGSGGLH